MRVEEQELGKGFSEDKFQCREGKRGEEKATGLTCDAMHLSCHINTSESTAESERDRDRERGYTGASAERRVSQMVPQIGNWKERASANRKFRLDANCVERKGVGSWSWEPNSVRAMQRLGGWAAGRPGG